MNKTLKPPNGGGGGIARFQKRPNKMKKPAESDANTNGNHGTTEPNGGSLNNVGISKGVKDDSAQPSPPLGPNVTAVDTTDSTPAPMLNNLQLSTPYDQSGFRKVTPNFSRNEAPFSPMVGAKPSATPNRQHPHATNSPDVDLMPLEQQYPELQVTYPHLSQGDCNDVISHQGPRVRSPQTVLPIPVAYQNLTPTTTMAPPAPRFAFLNKQTKTAFEPSTMNMPNKYLDDGSAEAYDIEAIVPTGMDRTGAPEAAMTKPLAHYDTVPESLYDPTHQTNDTFMNVDESEPVDPWTRTILPHDPPAAMETEKPVEVMSFAELVEEFDKNLTIASDKDVIFQSEFLDARVAVGAATSEFLKFKGLQWEFADGALEAINELDDILLSSAY